MSTIASGTKTAGYALLLQELTGVAPSIDISGPVPRIYYAPQEAWAAGQGLVHALEGPGDQGVKLEIGGIFVPYALKKLAPVALGLLHAGFLLGRL
jgi:hypothetical protein